MSDERHDETFPTLTEHELEMFREISHERAVHAGEILFDQGEPTTKLFVVLEGTVEIVNPRAAGGEPIVVYERGQLAGEMTLLGGGHALARAVARTAGIVLEVDRLRLRELLAASSALGEKLMRAFILRRANLMSTHSGDVVLVGSRHSADTLRVQQFLTRNMHPHETIDVDINRTIDTNGYPVFGRCDGSSWVDGDTPGMRGYPCRDQIGRSTDTSLWNYSRPAPPQALAPAYIWGNRNPSGELPVNLNRVGTSQQNADLALQLVESRDFYTFRSAFNGTKGVGEGPIAARPTSCTPGVGYWATDEGDWNAKNPGPDGQLYRCTAPNTWSLYYVPYPYPHPLASGGQPSVKVPAAPTNLTVQ